MVRRMRGRRAHLGHRGTVRDNGGRARHRRSLQGTRRLRARMPEDATRLKGSTDDQIMAMIDALRRRRPVSERFDDRYPRAPRSRGRGDRSPAGDTRRGRSRPHPGRLAETTPSRARFGITPHEATWWMMGYAAWGYPRDGRNETKKAITGRYRGREMTMERANRFRRRREEAGRLRYYHVLQLRQLQRRRSLLRGGALLPRKIDRYSLLGLEGQDPLVPESWLSYYCGRSAARRAAARRIPADFMMALRRFTIRRIRSAAS